MDVPKEIEKYLIRDEVIEKQFKLDNNWNAYASTKRIILKKRSTIRDIDYNHISSIQFTSNPNWALVLAGILSGAVGYYLQQNNTLGWALIFAGIVLLIAGFFFWKQQQVELSVVGLSSAFKLSGHRDTLDSLFKLVRERRT